MPAKEENALHFLELRRYDFVEMPAKEENALHFLEFRHYDFVETLAKEENALHFPDSRRYNYIDKVFVFFRGCSYGGRGAVPAADCYRAFGKRQESGKPLS